ncbi:TM2 domain-containing protein 3 isoform X1 [Parus major]|uniref:TM2 domain-containing protein 3 isoform X1 n=1 Tax=Parus major TaxID=9157 RepID=UPI001443F70D|nr:TM2 domain-containing protein 3 isoform X1 [Parus major]
MAAFRCAGSAGLELRCSVSGQNKGQAPLGGSCAALLHSTFCAGPFSRTCVTQNGLELLGTARVGGVTKLSSFHLCPVAAVRARQGLAHPEPSGGASRSDQRAAPAPAQTCLYSFIPAFRQGTACIASLYAGSLMTTKLSQPQSTLAKSLTSTSTNAPYFKALESTEIPPYVTNCPSNGLCSRLPPDCMTCNTNYSCIYGKTATFDCKVKPHVHCVDENNQEQENFTINMTCQFCWQLATSDYVCTNSTNCMTVSCPRQRYNATCTVRDHIHCLGNRVFPKMLYCNWTGGYKWSTALALSITLGGFGADRFYLGQWREGLGKLFSFGGLGIWTLIDVLLIGVGYVGPADGSLYI